MNRRIDTHDAVMVRVVICLTALAVIVGVIAACNPPDPSDMSNQKHRRTPPASTLRFP